MTALSVLGSFGLSAFASACICMLNNTCVGCLVEARPDKQPSEPGSCVDNSGVFVRSGKVVSAVLRTCMRTQVGPSLTYV